MVIEKFISLWMIFETVGKKKFYSRFMIAWKDLDFYMPCFGLFTGKIHSNIQTSGGALHT
jgi:hypothetical protein